ncbi:MAG TPA: hypothetical protein VF607_15725 [Verrucomicrobiae bacterium]
MNIGARLLIALAIGVTIAIVKFHWQESSRQTLATQLLLADTNRVIALLGPPEKVLPADHFNERTLAQAKAGFPVSNADVTATNQVWLYADGGIKYTQIRKYRTLFLDDGLHVTRELTTAWTQEP